MQQYSKWARISGKNDEFCNTAVEGLGSLVGALFQLMIMASLRTRVRLTSPRLTRHSPAERDPGSPGQAPSRRAAKPRFAH